MFPSIYAKTKQNETNNNNNSVVSKHREYWLNIREYLRKVKENFIKKINLEQVNNFIKVCKIREVPEFYVLYFIYFIENLQIQQQKHLLQRQIDLILSKKSYVFQIENKINSRKHLLESCKLIIKSLTALDKINNGQQQTESNSNTLIQQILSNCKSLQDIKKVEENKISQLALILKKIRKQTVELIQMIEQWKGSLMILNNKGIRFEKLSLIRIMYISNKQLNILIEILYDTDFLSKSFLSKYLNFIQKNDPFFLQVLKEKPSTRIQTIFLSYFKQTEKYEKIIKFMYKLTEQLHISTSPMKKSQSLVINNKSVNRQNKIYSKSNLKKQNQSNLQVITKKFQQKQINPNPYEKLIRKNKDSTSIIFQTKQQDLQKYLKKQKLKQQHEIKLLLNEKQKLEKQLEKERNKKNLQSKRNRQKIEQLQNEIQKLKYVWINQKNSSKIIEKQKNQMIRQKENQLKKLKKYFEQNNSYESIKSKQLYNNNQSFNLNDSAISKKNYELVIKQNLQLSKSLQKQSKKQDKSLEKLSMKLEDYNLEVKKLKQEKQEQKKLLTTLSKQQNLKLKEKQIQIKNIKLQMKNYDQKLQKLQKEKELNQKKNNTASKQKIFKKDLSILMTQNQKLQKDLQKQKSSREIEISDFKKKLETYNSQLNILKDAQKRKAFDEEHQFNKISKNNSSFDPMMSNRNIQIVKSKSVNNIQIIYASKGVKNKSKPAIITQKQQKEKYLNNRISNIQYNPQERHILQKGLNKNTLIEQKSKLQKQLEIQKQKQQKQIQKYQKKLQKYNQQLQKLKEQKKMKDQIIRQLKKQGKEIIKEKQSQLQTMQKYIKQRNNPQPILKANSSIKALQSKSSNKNIRQIYSNQKKNKILTKEYTQLNQQQKSNKVKNKIKQKEKQIQQKIKSDFLKQKNLINQQSTQKIEQFNTQKKNILKQYRELLQAEKKVFAQQKQQLLAIMKLREDTINEKKEFETKRKLESIQKSQKQKLYKLKTDFQIKQQKLQAQLQQQKLLRFQKQLKLKQQMQERERLSIKLQIQKLKENLQREIRKEIEDLQKIQLQKEKQELQEFSRKRQIQFQQNFLELNNQKQELIKLEQENEKKRIKIDSIKMKQNKSIQQVNQSQDQIIEQEQYLNEFKDDDNIDNLVNYYSHKEQKKQTFMNSSVVQNPERIKFMRNIIQDLNSRKNGQYYQSDKNPFIKQKFSNDQQNRILEKLLEGRYYKNNLQKDESIKNRIRQEIAAGRQKKLSDNRHQSKNFLMLNKQLLKKKSQNEINQEQMKKRMKTQISLEKRQNIEKRQEQAFQKYISRSKNKKQQAAENSIPKIKQKNNMMNNKKGKKQKVEKQQSLQIQIKKINNDIIMSQYEDQSKQYQNNIDEQNKQIIQNKQQNKQQFVMKDFKDNHTIQNSINNNVVILANQVDLNKTNKKDDNNSKIKKQKQQQSTQLKNNQIQIIKPKQQQTKQQIVDKNYDEYELQYQEQFEQLDQQQINQKLNKAPSQQLIKKHQQQPINKVKQQQQQSKNKQQIIVEEHKIQIQSILVKSQNEQNIQLQKLRNSIRNKYKLANYKVYIQYIHSDEIQNYLIQYGKLLSKDVLSLNQFDIKYLNKLMVGQQSYHVLIAKDQYDIEKGIGLFHKEQGKYIADHINIHNFKNFVDVLLNFCKYIFSEDSGTQKIQYKFAFSQANHEYADFYQELQQMITQFGQVYVKKNEMLQRKYIIKRNMFYDDDNNTIKVINSNQFCFNTKLFLIDPPLTLKAPLNIQNQIDSTSKQISIHIMLSQLQKVVLNQQEFEKLKLNAKKFIKLKQLLVTAVIMEKKYMKIEEIQKATYTKLQQIKSEIPEILNYVEKIPENNSINISKFVHEYQYPTKYLKQSTLKFDSYQKSYILMQPKQPSLILTSTSYTSTAYCLSLSNKMKIMFIGAEEFEELSNKNVEIDLFFYFKHFLKNIKEFKKQTFQRVFVPKIHKSQILESKDIAKNIEKQIFTIDEFHFGGNRIKNSIMYQPTHRDLVIKGPFIFCLISSKIEKILQGSPLYARYIRLTDIK